MPHRGLIFIEQLSDQFLISDVAFDKSKCGILGQLIQAKFFQCYIIIGIHIVDANNGSRRSFLINPFHKVSANKTSCTCDQNRFIFQHDVTHL